MTITTGDVIMKKDRLSSLHELAEQFPRAEVVLLERIAVALEKLVDRGALASHQKPEKPKKNPNWGLGPIKPFKSKEDAIACVRKYVSGCSAIGENQFTSYELSKYIERVTGDRCPSVMEMLEKSGALISLSLKQTSRFTYEIGEKQ